ncbi:hypothetical protein GCM10018952_76430 [Streptosporangium vulgare]
MTGPRRGSGGLRLPCGCPPFRAAGTRPRSAFGLGGQPFRLCVQCLDEDELQKEIFVNEADQNIHRASLTT